MNATLGSRRGHQLAKAIVFMVVLALVAGMGGCGGGTTNGTVPDTHPFAGGSGTTADPYHITNWTQLDAVRNYLDKNFIIMNDLDSTTAGYEELAGPNANGEKGWEPMGTVAFGVDPIPWIHYIPFKGSLEGQGYEVSDLFIDRPEESYIGLFGYIRKGVITDVGVVNAAVTGQSLVGSLLGWNEDGTVHNSYATGNVTGSGRVGGLVGDNWGVVSNCYATTDATGESNVGGLVGRNYGTVTNCYYNYDEVLINGQNVITTGALFGEDFEEWLANDRFLDVTERLSQEDGYYVINDASDLKQLLAFGQDSSLKFKLKNDLDLAGEPGLYIPYLAAEFDGNGHKISNLSFSFDFVSQVGLFGRLAASGKVIAVCVENVSLTGHEDVGGLMGRNNGGTVSNAYATGSVTGGTNVGGLAGRNAGTVSNSYASVNVTGNKYVGGLVGDNYGPVSDSYATGSVTGSSSVGGLVGDNYGTASNCYSTGSVTGSSSVGGLVGQNWHGTVSNSYASGSVMGDQKVGGIVGLNRKATVENSYATGIVTGEWAVGGLVGWSLEGTVNNSYSAASVIGGDAVGGIVGLNRKATVENCYAEGGVTGDQYVGGLVGANEDSIITNCYSSAGVSGTWDVGGLVGWNDATVTNSFWDTETSGQYTSDGGTGKTTAEMQDIATLLDAGWDIVLMQDHLDETWCIDDGNDYPRLGWQYQD